MPSTSAAKDQKMGMKTFKRPGVVSRILETFTEEELKNIVVTGRTAVILHTDVTRTKIINVFATSKAAFDAILSKRGVTPVLNKNGVPYADIGQQIRLWFTPSYAEHISPATVAKSLEGIQVENPDVLVDLYSRKLERAPDNGFYKTVIAALKELPSSPDIPATA
jgi:hypothetical protein